MWEFTHLICTHDMACHCDVRSLHVWRGIVPTTFIFHAVHISTNPQRRRNRHSNARTMRRLGALLIPQRHGLPSWFRVWNLDATFSSARLSLKDVRTRDRNWSEESHEAISEKHRCLATKTRRKYVAFHDSAWGKYMLSTSYLGCPQ